jgi:hypothetical protein
VDQECEYCFKRLGSQKSLATHWCTCTARKRLLLRDSPQAKLAYAIYLQWRRMCRWSEPSFEQFLDCRDFTAYVNFAEFIDRVGIAHPEIYLHQMFKANKMPPRSWRSNECYRRYRVAVDFVEPWTAVQRSIEILQDKSQELGIELGQVADSLGPQGIIQLVRTKQLSPWVAFNSASLRNAMDKFDSLHMKALEQALDITVWKARFDAKVDLRKEIQRVTREIGL